MKANRIIVLAGLMACTITLAAQNPTRHRRQHDNGRHEPTEQPQHHHDSHQEPHVGCTHGQNVAPMMGATAEQVRLIREFVESFSFSSDRLRAAKFSVSICPLATDDISSLLELFSFDDARKEVLKAAYPLCPDKQRYFNAVNKLTFNSNKKEVWDFIEGYESGKPFER